MNNYEEVIITNGQNIIDIFFDSFSSCLVFKEGLAVNWFDCEGSVGEYYAISDYTPEERDKYTIELNDVLIDGEDKEQLEKIKNFLNLFGNGIYFFGKTTLNLKKSTFLSSNNTVYENGINLEEGLSGNLTSVVYGMKGNPVSENERFSGSFFPSYINHSDYYIYTLPRNRVNYERIKHYKKLIEEGTKPTIVFIHAYDTRETTYSNYYILDGHHKIQAYLELKIDIPAIWITKRHDKTNQTHLILKNSKNILKSFEFEHLFFNNDDNMETIDFVNDDNLTKLFDKELSQSWNLGYPFKKILEKISKSSDEKHKKWLTKRLSILKNNTSKRNYEDLVEWMNRFE